jgi:hypothetical protein
MFEKSQDFQTALGIDLGVGDVHDVGEERARAAGAGGDCRVGCWAASSVGWLAKRGELKFRPYTSQFTSPKRRRKERGRTKVPPLHKPKHEPKHKSKTPEKRKRGELKFRPYTIQEREMSKDMDS